MTAEQILEYVETTDIDVFDDEETPAVAPAILEQCRAVVAAENAENETARAIAEIDAIAPFAARQDAASAAIETALTPAEMEAKERWEAAELRRTRSETRSSARHGGRPRHALAPEAVV